MRRRIRRRFSRMGHWFIEEPWGRLSVGVCVWLVILTAFTFIADPSLWAGFVLGAICPVSLWMAFEGHWLPEPTHLDSLLMLTPRQF